MNCEDFQLLLADTLGGELSDAQRPGFEAHIAQCSQCRREYESMRETVCSLLSLPEPQPVRVRRVGGRLILGESPRGAMAAFSHGYLRYAAGLLIAFTAGYALHATLTPRGVTRTAARQRGTLVRERASLNRLWSLSGNRLRTSQYMGRPHRTRSWAASMR